MELQLPYGEVIWLDASGSRASTQMHFSPGTTVADADAALYELASLLLPLTGCTLVETRIRYKAVNLERGTAVSGNSVKRAGVLIFSDDLGVNWVLVNIPAINADVLEPDGAGSGILIDTDSSSVIAFVEAFLDGDFTTPFAGEVNVLRSAYRQSRT